MPPRLIVNADDFGLTPGINRAVVELHQAGVVSSASLMASADATDDAIRLAHAHPRLGIGCHLVFVDGMPLAHPESIPTLLGGDAKSFRTSYVDFVQALLRGSIRQAELALETQAQIQHLQRAGIDITHVDTHKHLHRFSLVLDTVRYVADRCGVEAIRYPFEPVWSARATHPPLLRRLQMAALDAVPQTAWGQCAPTVLDAERARSLTTHGTLGIAATGSLDAAALRAIVSRLAVQPADRTYELCCHPGHLDDALAAASTRLKTSRAVEFQTLLEVIPDFYRTDAIEPAGELIHYGNLGVPGLKRASGQYSPSTGFEKVL